MPKRLEDELLSAAVRAAVSEAPAGRYLQRQWALSYRARELAKRRRDTAIKRALEAKLTVEAVQAKRRATFAAKRIAKQRGEKWNPYAPWVEDMRRAAAEEARAKVMEEGRREIEKQGGGGGRVGRGGGGKTGRGAGMG